MNITGLGHTQPNINKSLKVDLIVIRLTTT
jgi:hypothetical protein